MGQIARLALPVSLSRAGMLALVIADMVMVGRTDTLALAHYSLATALFLVLMLVGTGMLIGTAVLSSQALGAGSAAEAGVVWRVGMAAGAILGLVFLVLSQFGTPFYLLIGEPENLAEGAGGVLAYAGLGLPGALVFVACSLFLESLRRPMAGFLAMVVANLANIAANWWLLSDSAYGGGGGALTPAEGAALATAGARWLAAFLLLAYILMALDHRHFNLTGPMAAWRAVAAKMGRLGLALGIAQGLESLAFACLTIFAGYLGAVPTAAFAIIMNVIATVFMGAIGIATATVVQVGRAVGGADPGEAPRAGWAGVLTVILYMAGAAALVSALAAPLAGLYTLDPVLISMVVPALAVAGIIFIPDGMQAVLMGALRGVGEAWAPTYLHLLSFVGVMIPVSAYLSLGTGLGVMGLILGTLAGVLVASAVLGGRFLVVGRRDIRRL